MEYPEGVPAKLPVTMLPTIPITTPHVLVKPKSLPASSGATSCKGTRGQEKQSFGSILGIALISKEGGDVRNVVGIFFARTTGGDSIQGHRVLHKGLH